MHPRIAKGRSSHSKCLSEKKYKPLQFETFNVSERKPSDGLTSLLTGVDLGGIDEDWFNKKRQTKLTDGCKEDDNPADGMIAATPQHGRQCKDLEPSPSLFSPEESSSKNKRRKIGGITPVYPGFPRNMGVYDSPATTPGIAAFTPNQATGKTLDPSQSSQQQSQASTTGFSPFPSWNPTNKTATPAFMKQLFKTPSSVVRTPGRKIATPDSLISVSASQRLSISLGADLDDSNLSWTSSLATPPGSKSNSKMGNSDGTQSEAEMRVGVMPKALHFSSQADIKTAASVDKGCDTHSQSLDNDTQPLQLLRLSSLEEDGTSEDTLDSDVIGDKEDDGDVVMGIPSVEKQLIKRNENDKPSMNSEKPSTSKDEKHSLSDTSVLMEDESKMQDDDVRHFPSGIQDRPKIKEVDVGSDIDELNDVSKESPTAKDNNSSSTRSKENEKTSPKRKKKTTPEDDCREGAKAGNVTNSQSNIEETIAFFLATPPQRRAKLGKISAASGRVNSQKTSKVNDVVREDKIGEVSDVPKESPTNLETKSTVARKFSTVVGNKEEVEEKEIVTEIDMKTSTEQISGKDVSRNQLEKDGNVVLLVEKDSKTTDIVEEVSKEPLQPNQLDQQQATPRRLTSSAASISLNATHNTIDVTPISQADHQDLFSQISPNYADALCRAVDAVADNPNTTVKNVSLITTPKPQDPSQPSSTVLNSSGMEVGREPAGQVMEKQVHGENQHKSGLSRCTSEDQSGSATSEPKQVTSSATTSSSADQNVEETATAIFRMKPKTTKKFYYPSANSSPIPDVRKTDQHSTTPKLMAGTLHVVEEEGSDTEGGQMNASTSQASSSTPASRNSSGFVTFSSFMKSIEKDPKSTTTSNHTPTSSGSMISHQQHPSASKVTPSVGGNGIQHAILKDNLPLVAAGGQHQTGNSSTPVRGRRTGALSLKSRRRLGRSSLPPPKRLKTLVEQEDFHQNLDSIDNQEDDEVQFVKVCPPDSSSNQIAEGLMSGFKTAANKTINITQNSLQKARDMMAEIDGEENEQLQAGAVSSAISAGGMVSGFQTAGKKEIKISSGSLQKAKGMMTEIYSQDIQLPPNMDSKVLNQADTPSLVSGFQTAGKKEIKISSGSLQKAKGMMAEIYSQDIQVPPNMDSKVSNQADVQPFVSGFQTAGKKPISISSGSLQRAKGMMAEIYSQDIQLPPNMDSNKSSNFTGRQPIVSGFQTAGKKPINISSGSLQKAKGMIAEIYSQDIQIPSELPSDSTKTTTQGTCCSLNPTKEARPASAHIGSLKDESNCPQQVGFSSASGKAIKISAASMMKAHRLVDEVERELDSSRKPNLQKRDSGNVSNTSIDREKNETLQESHFQEESMSNVRAEGLSHTSMHNVEKELMLEPSKNIPSKVGFTSASGKCISISAKAMKKAQSFMASVESDPEQETKSRSNGSKMIAGQDQEPSFVGFKSASGKSIKISEDALKKAEILVRDAQQMEEESLHAARKGKTPVSDVESFKKESAVPFAVGFSSASGKALSVSASALRKAKSLMDEVNQTMSDSTLEGKSGTPDHSFTSNDDSGINTSDSALPTFNSSSREILSVEKSPIHLSGPIKTTGGLHNRQRPLQMAAQGGKPKKDYSKLPKGFRPFKPPSRVDSSRKALPTRRQSGRLLKAATVKTESSMDFNGNKSNSQTVFESPGGMVSGFQTAGKKDIKISSGSLQKAKGLMAEIYSQDIQLPSIAAVKSEPRTDLNRTKSNSQCLIESPCPLSNNKTANGNIIAPSMTSRSTPSTNMPRTEPHDGFSDDDGISPSQAQREIQAAEHTELMYAFMKAEEEAFVEDSDQDHQDPVKMDTNIKPDGEKHPPDDPKSIQKLVHDVKEQVPYLKVDAMLIDDSFIKEEDLHLIAKVEAHHTNNLGKRDNLMNNSVVSSRATQLDGSLNQGFVNSQVTVSSHVDEAEIGLCDRDGQNSGTVKQVHVLSEDVNLVLAELQTMKQQQLKKRNSNNVQSDGMTRSSKMIPAVRSQRAKETSIDVVGAVEKPPEFAGFRTGSGKRVSISAAALEKAKSMISSDGADDLNLPRSRTDNLQASSSSCASNVLYHRSSQPMSIASSVEKQIAQGPNDIHPSSNGRFSVGFCTAGGTQVQVSDASIQRAKEVLNENQADNNKSPSRRDDGYDDRAVPTAVGFQTASGRKVQFSERSLQKAKVLLHEDSDHPEDVVMQEKQNGLGLKTAECEASKGFIGFQTASGNSVSISDSALERARNMLSEKLCDESYSRHVSPQGNEFGGFQTAGGKKVHISEKALEKAQQMLNEDVDNSNASSAPQRSGFSGFQTAGGKKVHISEKALAKAQQMLKEDVDPSNAISVPENSGFSGFQTAGGKKVHISENALIKAQQMLKEDADCSDPSRVPQSIGFAGFQNAGGKKVHISEEALEKAQHMLKEDADQSNVPQISGFSGFQTADGKKVHISEEALDKAQQMLKEDDDGSRNVVSPSSGFAGFQTASGKQVQISDQALENARQMLTDDQADDDRSLVSQNKGFAGFQTASGSKVSISEDAIKKAQKFVNRDNESSFTTPQPSRPSTGFAGFVTASGNKVNISDDAIKKAQTFLNQDPERSIATPQPSRPRTGFTGFMTASGSKVNISEDVIKKAQTFLNQDSDNSVPTPQPSRPSTGFSGFMTASGSKVNISEDAIRQAQTFLNQDSDNSTPTPQPARSNTGFAGFMTASGSKVNISDDAIKKAQKFLNQDSDNSNGTPQPSRPSSGFGGFVTASGSKVNISEDAIKKAQKFLNQDSESPVPRPQPSRSSTGFARFQTASGNKVDISEESLRVAKNLIAHDSTEDSRGSTRTMLHSSSNDNFVGFTTASGSRVQVSEQSLKMARNLLSDEMEQSGEESNGVVPQQPPHTHFVGFKSASGNNVEVSEESLRIARGLIASDPPQNNNPNRNRVETETLTRNSGFTGFSTASGSRVEVSDESLRIARGLIASDPPQNNSNGSRIETEAATRNTGFAGFSTASGSRVEVSEESLRIARGLIASEPPQNKSKGSRIETEVPKRNPGFAGFSTASGSRVEVSEESLRIARGLIASEPPHTDNQNHSREETEVLTRNPGFAGFSTASGSRVEVSEESLRIGRGLIASETPQNDNQNRRKEEKKTPTRNPGFAGFSTASGSRVEVSEESLRIARGLIESDPPQNANPNHSRVETEVPTRNTGFAGFSTASGSRVEVSEESLRIARGLIESDPPQNANPNHSRAETEVATRNTGFAGFLTASGSRVEVSEESLRLAKNVIAEEDKTTEKPYGIVPQGYGPTGASIADRPAASHTLQGGGNGAMYDHGTGSGDDGVVPQRKRTRMDQGGMVGARSAEGSTRKHFIPFRRQHLPVSSSPAGQWADRSSNAMGQSSKSFKPYCTTPVTGNGVSSNKQVLPKGVASQTRTTTKVQSEQVQVVPQQSLQSNQWTRKSVPFYKKPNFQPGRAGSQAQKSFQKFVPPGNTVNSTISDSRSPQSDSSGGGQIGLDMQQVWQQARMKQKARIEAKKKQRIKPYPGSLLSKRQHIPRIKLYEVVDGQSPQQYSQQQLFSDGLLPSTLQVNAAKAECFKFKGAEHFSQVAMATEDGILLGDGGRVVLDDNGMAGKEEFYHALLDTNGVDPKLVSEEWVANHYQWIVWKLAAMEVAYPQQFAARLLTPHWVMLQLKYRYDREIDNSQRSALKKILERDDTPSRRLVLCVSAICKNEPVVAQVENNKGDGTNGKNNTQKPASVTTLELTDGWYCIKTTIDKALLNLVQKGKIFAGQKLCIYGAELVGSDDACSPLEVPANLMLRINANSTRPARYDAKLGLQRDPRPYPVTLSSLYGEGGVAGCLDVVVVRCYPIQYMEKHEEGGATFRNNRAEEKEARKYSREKQLRMEKLFTKIQKEFEKKQAKKEPRRKTRSRSSQHLKEAQIRELCTGQEIYEALNDAYDPGAIEMHLSEKQMTSLHNYQRSLQEKEQGDLQAEFRKALEEQEEESKERVVTPLLRVRLTDYRHTSKTVDPLSQTCQMTVWRPTEDIMAYLTEGKRLKLYNVNVSSAGRYSQTSNSVQLASTKRTRYKELPAENSQLSEVYQPRTPTPIWYLRQSGYEALYGETDLVGLVTSINSGSSGRNSGSNMQTICVADSNANIITVKFWGGLQAYCVEDLIKVGTYICCSNLQYKGRDRYNAVPYLQATDISSFTQTPKSEGMRQALTVLKQNIKNPQEFINYVQSMVHSLATTPQPVKTTTMSTRQLRVASSFVLSTSTSRHHTMNAETLQPLKTPTMHARQPRVASPFTVSTSTTGASKFQSTNMEQKNVDNPCDPSPVGPQISPPVGSVPLKPNSSMNKVTDAVPPVKRFVPYTGVKNNQTPSNSKTFTPASSRGVQNYPVTGQYSSFNKGSASSSKSFTPMSGHSNRVATTPVGVHQNGAGKVGNQARSNLFGSASGMTTGNLNTPLNGAVGGFDGSFHSEDGSSSQSSQLEEKRKDADRRHSLLGRIASPPALSPLPSPLSGAVRRGFRLPNRCRMNASNGADRPNERGYLKRKVDDDETDHASDSRLASSLDRTNQQDGPISERNDKMLTEGLTDSQREVQEVMGMSLSCLDMEWSQQTPVKSDLKPPSYDADSPPMDLSYPEKEEEPVTIQEKMKQVKTTENAQPPEAKVAHTLGQSSNKCDQVSTYNSEMNSTKSVSTSKPELSQDSTISTEMSQDSTQSDDIRVKKKQTKGRRRAGKRPAKESPSTLEKPSQSKRFCTRADYAVIDFESLEGADGVATRRVTRSSKRLQRS